MYKVMIIEDEQQIRQELKVLLDVTLPGTDGITLCKNIRKTSNVPIIFLTSRNTVIDELNGMTMGGDDYISKPFYAPVLLARITAVVKRTAGTRQEQGEKRHLNVKGCVLNLLDSTVSYGGKSVRLTKNEVRICFCLFSNEGRIVPREEIMDDLWENHIFIDDNTLSVHITHIRAKLKEIGLSSLIETKRGQGYLVPASL